MFNSNAGNGADLAINEANNIISYIEIPSRKIIQLRKIICTRSVCLIKDAN